MLLTIFLLLFVLSLLAVFYGANYRHGEMVMVGFSFLFVLGLTLAGVGGLFGGVGGVEVPTGELHSYSYAANATGQNDNIQSVSIASTYTTYSSVFFGSWVAILSFFGFLGSLLQGSLRWFN